MRKILLILLFFSTFSFSQCWNTVSPGGAHTIAIRDGGAIFTWGRNNQGQLGLGTTGGTQNTPQQVGSDFNWQTISAGNSHNLVIKTTGTLWAWGNNADGQIGVGSNAARFNIPQQIGTDTNWSKISAGDEYCVAIKTDGTLWTWGDNTYGQLGDNSTADKNAPVQIGTATDWIQISAGTDHTLALKSNGTLWAWGRNNVGQFGTASPTSSLVPIQIGTDTNWSKIFAAREHSIAIKTDTTYWVWGGNTNGQFGNTTTTSSATPTAITSFNNPLQISKGHQHSIIIKQDGTLWSTGGNASGQLGNGNNTQQTTPVQENTLATNWSFVSSKVSHTAALKSDGTLYTWGANLYGQLGDGTGSAKNTPTIITCPMLTVEENFVAEKITIYPNPTNGFINIPSEFGIHKIVIYDLSGKILVEKELYSEAVDVQNLTSGMYLIKLFGGNKNYQTKFIKI
ncbi:T9SS type A sorting domain-containing protein [Flavobacterium amnicola]|uniref:T9SS type A sorting domain-containing protein n=1 Tax=Flavobacterium amnicola TaxID=2506422 RepID=A0A4Q1K4W0_9FLAO|nr:T9SS type A sorting domain-containing protein [Flavobacterium amnicola]RXR20916.1 T9SS type A sorting domain-containing protein [Flavobacterium amnicola]